MASLQILPSTTSEEIVSVLGSLLGDNATGIGDHHFQRDWSALWSQLSEGGWTMLADGPGAGTDGNFSLLDLSLVAETWGRFLVPLPLISTLVARRWLTDRPEASIPLSLLLATPSAGIIPHGEHVQQVLVGDVLYPRFKLGDAVGQDRHAPSMPLSSVATGVIASARPAREAAILAAAEALGAAHEALRITVEYVKIREQFGRPIGSFQAIKHRLADLHMREELARSAILWSCAEGDAVRPATRAVFEHGIRIVEGCIQAHGGIGFTWAGAPHWYLRHVMSCRRVGRIAVQQLDFSRSQTAGRGK